MSLETRNTIILAVVWFLLISGGFLYTKFRLAKEVNELENTKKEIADFPNFIKEVNLLALQSTEMKQKYFLRKKEIPSSDQSSKSYDYMMNALDQAGNIKADVKFKERVNLDDFGYDTYMLLQGECQYTNFYKLIYLLEHGRYLYRVHNLNLVYDPTNGTQQTMKFDMEVHAYYSAIAGLETSLSTKEPTMPPSPRYSFFPSPVRVVQKEKPPAGAIDPNALEVEIVIPGKAFIRYKNTSKFLEVGDTVWRGYVSNIDPAKGTVEFTIKVDGVTRKIEKRVKISKKK